MMGILQLLGLLLAPGTYVLLGPIWSSPSSRGSGGGEGSLMGGAPVGIRGGSLGWWAPAGTVADVLARCVPLVLASPSGIT